MMSLQPRNVLLLVILTSLLAGNAHAHNLMPRSTGVLAHDVTSLDETETEAEATASLEASMGAAAAELNAVKHQLMSLEALRFHRSRHPTTFVSTVQDWSLVCQELCGAGLNGLPCDGFCSSEVQNVTQHGNISSLAIPSEVKAPLCVDLCRLRLGGTACECSFIETPMPLRPPHERDLVCHAYCTHSKQTLNGCSTCKSKGELYPAPMQTIDGIEKETTTTELNASKVQSFTSHGSHDIGLRQADSSPDWNELCKSLCKTGDGGSLCNCDLSPFLLR